MTMLNVNDLNTIKGLLQYASSNVPDDLDVEIRVGDSNGDCLGTIKRVDLCEYQFFAGSQE